LAAHRTNWLRPGGRKASTTHGHEHKAAEPIKARKEMTKAATELGKKHPAQAIEHCRNAWEKARQSV
jgi:hypothetical protein